MRLGRLPSSSAWLPKKSGVEAQAGSPRKLKPDRNRRAVGEGGNELAAHLSRLMSAFHPKRTLGRVAERPC